MDGREKREYRRKMGNFQREKKKFAYVSLGGTLITSVAIALELFAGHLIKPKDAGYWFTSDDVSLSQEVPEDYSTKSYMVSFDDGSSKIFSFEDLDKIEPNVQRGYTYISSDNLPEGTNLGIQRVEVNPDRQIFNGVMFGAAIAGLSTAALSQRKIGDIEKEENEYRWKTRR